MQGDVGALPIEQEHLAGMLSAYVRLSDTRMPLEITSSPVMDGVLLTEETASIMPEGRFSIKPVLAGSTGDEMKMVDNQSWYKNLGIVMNEADYQKKCATVYGEEGTRLAEAIRPLAKDLPDLQFKMIEIPMFHASVLKTLEHFSAGTNAYGYRMNYVPAREVYDSDLFDRLQKDFMRGRDASFIA